MSTDVFSQHNKLHLGSASMNSVHIHKDSNIGSCRVLNKSHLLPDLHFTYEPMTVDLHEAVHEIY